MAIDTPAKIAILGAGPIGLETALYARFLGYDVIVFDAGEIAENVRRWGQVRMFTPFGMNRSPLGLAAIQAQDESYRPPGDDELLTGHQWLNRYLLPLASTDLIADHLRLRTKVISVGKEELLKGELPGHPNRGDWGFQILTRNAAGEESIEVADGVIDCTGVLGQANYLGPGGLPAIGELALREEIEYRLPDILGSGRDKYASQVTVVVGSGFSAATNVVALQHLAQTAPGTRVFWLTRREGPAGVGPIAMLESDRLPERAELARLANAAAADSAGDVTHGVGTVQRISRRAEDGLLLVEFAGGQEPIACDRIIANVGYRPDNRIYEELQVHECYASQGPMKLAAALLGQAGADCLDQQSCGPQTLLNPEPNFYILGAKSYGRKSNFLLSVGLEQIREVFTIIGDRPTLNLYAGAHRLLQ